MMQKAEKDLVVKHEMLYVGMRCYKPANIDETNVHLVNEKMFSIDKALCDLEGGIKTLLLSHSDSLGSERVEKWKTVQSTSEKDSIEYCKSVYQKSNEVKYGSTFINEELKAGRLQWMRRNDDSPLNMYAVTILDLMEKAQPEKENEGE